MNSVTQDRLRALNRRFYEARAEAFDASRDHPWPGWRRVARTLRDDPNAARTWRVLDAACGNARFARFLAEQTELRVDYLGVDASAPLLEAAKRQLEAIPERRAPARWALRHLDVLDGEARRALPARGFDLVAVFGLTHHIPAARARMETLQWLADLVAPAGWIAITAWRFADRPRFEERLVPWSQLGAPFTVDPSELEPGDHLLGFGAGPGPLRYCHHSDEGELERWIGALLDAGFERPLRFVEDGSSHDLNHYLMARRHGAH